jgi:hypothetical protein
LYDKLIEHPEMVELFQRFPEEVSVDRLIAKIIELLPQLITDGFITGDSTLDLFDDFEEADYGSGRVSSMGFAYLEAVWEQIVIPLWEWAGQEPAYSKEEFIDAMYQELDYLQNTLPPAPDLNPNPTTDLDPWFQFKGRVRLKLLDPNNRFLPEFIYIILNFDLSKLEEDTLALHRLLLWYPEEELQLIVQLSSALESLQPIRIGDQIVPVPFKADFDKFLTGMISRQVNLAELAEQYFGVGGDTEEDNLLAKGFKWVFEQSDKFITQENIEALFRSPIPVEGGPVAPDISWAWENLIEPVIGEDTANEVLATLATAGYDISQLGTNFRQALETSPLDALKGMACGMVIGTPLGLLVDLIDLAVNSEYYIDEDGNLWITEKRAFGAWREELFGNQSDAFKSGLAIGEFGMGVSDLLVGTKGLGKKIPTQGAGFQSLTISRMSTTLAGVLAFKAETTVIISWSQARQLRLVAAGAGWRGSGLTSMYQAMTTRDSSSGEPPEGWTVERTHDEGNRRVVDKNGRKWNLPEGRSFEDIPETDPVGDALQAATDRVASQWKPEYLTPAELDRIRKAQGEGEFWLADLLKQEAKGRWVEQRVRQEFTELTWFSTGPDAIDPSTGLVYDILSGSMSNMDSKVTPIVKTTNRTK